MHVVVFATIKDGMGPRRQDLETEYGSYLLDQGRHPSVTLHHGGPTLADDGETVNGLLHVLEAPSLEAARAFVAGSPYGRAGLLAECHVRPWNWLTGSPG